MRNSCSGLVLTLALFFSTALAAQGLFDKPELRELNATQFLAATEQATKGSVSDLLASELWINIIAESVFTKLGMKPELGWGDVSLTALISRFPRLLCREVYNSGKPHPVCGVVGGSFRYTLRAWMKGKSASDVAEAFYLGAFNQASYERAAPHIGEALEKGQLSKLFAIVMGIEGAEGYLQSILRNHQGAEVFKNIGPNVLAGSIIAAVVAVSEHFSLEAWVRSYL